MVAKRRGGASSQPGRVCVHVCCCCYGTVVFRTCQQHLFLVTIFRLLVNIACVNQQILANSRLLCLNRKIWDSQEFSMSADHAPTSVLSAYWAIPTACLMLVSSTQFPLLKGNCRKPAQIPSLSSVILTDLPLPHTPFCS